MSYKDASWGKAWAGYLGALGLSFITPWGWSGSIIAGALMSSADDVRLRSVGNGILWGVGSASAAVLAAGTVVATNWDEFSRYMMSPLAPRSVGTLPVAAPLNSTTIAGPASYAGNLYYWKNWHEKQRQQQATAMQ